MSFEKKYTLEEVSAMLMDSDFEDEGDVDVSSDSDVEIDINQPGPSGTQGQPIEVDTNSEEEEPPCKLRKESLKWTKDNLTPTVFQFENEGAGFSKEEFQSNSSPGFIFSKFFGEDIIEKILCETNRYFTFVKGEKQLSSHSRLQRWKDTTVNEIYTFISLTLLMSRVLKLKYDEYWSRDKFLETPIFREIMSRDRYLLVLRLLHFSDNSITSGDHLKKIRAIIEHLRAIFGRMLKPYKNLCIDESLMLFKGRLSFKQYIPSKRCRFGIKLFVLCDNKTGFILDFIVYTGISSDVNDYGLGVSGNTVVTLLQPYLDQGHSIYVDNWYSSPSLFLWLYDKFTNACGTVRRNRKDMPAMAEKLKRGEFTYRSASGKIIALKWQDKKEVWMLSTLHSAEINETNKVDYKTGQKILKPTIVIDYNKNMGIVDKTDMILSATTSSRKSTKWYKKLFFHLVDLCVYNSHIIYNNSRPQKIPYAQFHLQLVKDLVEMHPTEKPEPRTSTKEIETRLVGRHFPGKFDRNIFRDCVVCKKNDDKKRKRSAYKCKQCEVALCIDNCFEVYHTKKKL